MMSGLVIVILSALQSSSNGHLAQFVGWITMVQTFIQTLSKSLCIMTLVVLLHLQTAQSLLHTYRHQHHLLQSSHRHLYRVLVAMRLIIWRSLYTRIPLRSPREPTVLTCHHIHLVGLHLCADHAGLGKLHHGKQVIHGSLSDCVLQAIIMPFIVGCEPSAAQKHVTVLCRRISFH